MLPRIIWEPAAGHFRAFAVGNHAPRLAAPPQHLPPAVLPSGDPEHPLVTARKCLFWGWCLVGKVERRGRSLASVVLYEFPQDEGVYWRLWEQTRIKLETIRAGQ